MLLSSGASGLRRSNAGYTAAHIAANNSEYSASLRKSGSGGRSQRRKSGSSKRRKRSTPDRHSGQQNAPYDLFAERHLRRIEDSGQGSVTVNKKYELTAANTSKLWSKFEQEILGKPAHDDMWREPAAETKKPQVERALHQDDFLDSATKFG